jgi:uncharacterized protein YndB with AHSA1/START domain
MGLEIGRLAVRRSAFIRAVPARVWREFESEERIRGWLDRGHMLHRIEPRVGGAARFSVEIDGERRYFGGAVLICDAQRELSLESQWEKPWDADYSRLPPSYWTFRLTPLYAGTLVEIFHHGFELAGAGAADALEGYEQGWDTKHLLALRAVVESAS